MKKTILVIILIVLAIVYRFTLKEVIKEEEHNNNCEFVAKSNSGNFSFSETKAGEYRYQTTTTNDGYVEVYRCKVNGII